MGSEEGRVCVDKTVRGDGMVKCELGLNLAGLFLSCREVNGLEATPRIREASPASSGPEVWGVGEQGLSPLDGTQGKKSPSARTKVPRVRVRDSLDEIKSPLATDETQ